MTHFKMRELCRTDRPRERLCALGAQALTNAELLAILIGSGTRQKSALQIAEELTVHERLYRAPAGGMCRISARSKAWERPGRHASWRRWSWANG